MRFVCPECRNRLHGIDELLGQVGRCPWCGEEFTVVDLENPQPYSEQKMKRWIITVFLISAPLIMGGILCLFFAVRLDVLTVPLIILGSALIGAPGGYILVSLFGRRCPRCKRWYGIESDGQLDEEKCNWWRSCIYCGHHEWEKQVGQPGIDL